MFMFTTYCLSTCFLYLCRSDEDIMEMITEADVDQDGQISFNEFYRIMKKRSANPLDDWDSDDD